MKRWSLVLLLACGGLPAGSAQSTSDADVPSKIIALEHAWNRACEIKDLKALDTLLDDSFVYVAPDGRSLTKPEVLADVKASDTYQVLTEAMTVHLHGDTAVVTGVFRMKGLKRGKAAVQSGRFIDTWLRRNGSWISIASVATPTED